MADKTVQKQCPARVSRKSTFSKVFDKSVRQDYRARLSSMTQSRYSTSMSPKSVEQVCPIRASRKQCRSRVSRKNAPQGCFPRVSCKGALYKSSQTWAHSGAWVLSGFCLLVRAFCLVLLFGSFCVVFGLLCFVCLAALFFWDLNF